MTQATATQMTTKNTSNAKNVMQSLKAKTQQKINTIGIYVRIELALVHVVFGQTNKAEGIH